MTQKISGMIGHFLDRFKEARMCCNMKVPKEEYIDTTLMGMRNFKLVKDYEGKTFKDLAKLIRVLQYE